MFSSFRSIPFPYDTSDRLADESPLEPDCPFYDWWVSFPYVAVKGSILYMAINTRRDIIFHTLLQVHLHSGRVHYGARVYFLLCSSSRFHSQFSLRDWPVIDSAHSLLKKIREL